MKFEIGEMYYQFIRGQVTDFRDLNRFEYGGEENSYDLISGDQFEDFMAFCEILDRNELDVSEDRRAICTLYLDALTGNGY